MVGCFECQKVLEECGNSISDLGVDTSNIVFIFEPCYIHELASFSF